MSETEWEAACHHTDTCALTGSAAFFMGIPKSHVLVNGPIWCYFYALRYLEDAAGYLSSHVTCTQPPGRRRSDPRISGDPGCGYAGEGLCGE